MRFTPLFTPENVKLGVFILISQKLALHLFVYRLLWLYGIILGTLSPLTFSILLKISGFIRYVVNLGKMNSY